MFNNSAYIYFYFYLLILLLFCKITFFKNIVNNILHIVNYLFLFYYFYFNFFKKIKNFNNLIILICFYFIGGLLWSYLLYNSYWSWDIIEFLGFFILFLFIKKNHNKYKNKTNIIILLLIVYKLYYFNFFYSLHNFNLNIVYKNYFKKNYITEFNNKYLILLILNIKFYKILYIKKTNKINFFKNLFFLLKFNKIIKAQHVIYLFILIAIKWITEISSS